MDDTKTPLHDLEEHICSTFLVTAKELSSRMKYRQAMSCYRTALNLLAEQGSQDSNSDKRKTEVNVYIYCTALSSAVELGLHLNDVETARDILGDYQHQIVFPSAPSDIIQSDKVHWTFGYAYLNLSKAFMDQHCMSTAKETLLKGKDHLYQLNSEEAQISYAELLGLLGACLICSGEYSEAEDLLLDAIELWRKLKYPLHCITLCINAMQHYIDCRLREPTDFVDEHNVCVDMLRLHKGLYGRGLNLEVPECFTELGYIAYRQEKENTSLAFFEEALALYKQMPDTDAHHENVLKLLKVVGVASYNCRNFEKAANVYKECLDDLKLRNSAAAHGTTSGNNMAAMAECYAALGFTYSRLRQFDCVIDYYEKALELHTLLCTDDLELIETNIGSLYHVKAVVNEEKGDGDNAKMYFDMAEAAFTKALKYSWKSFPFINYGYYLLCRQDYQKATHMLQQGFLNGRMDKDTVEFDHTEDPILLDDLKRELEGCEEIRMPSTIIALYLKAYCLVRMQDPTATQAALELKTETEACRFDQYFTEYFGVERMKALCVSLAGYVYKMLGDKAMTRACFQRALDLHPDYPTAAENIKSLAT